MVIRCTNSPVPILTLINSLTKQSLRSKLILITLAIKLFRVLTEIVALKWPDQCLPMVQYVAQISDNIGRLTCTATFNYDIKFRLKKQMKQALKWNEIDNSLWTKYFFRSGRDGYHTSASSTSAFKRTD